MNNARPEKPRVLLIRFGAIGNALVAVPAIRALRLAWPDAFVALAGDPLTLELLSPCPYIDEFIRYDMKGPEAFGRGYSNFILRLRRRRFTHAIHFKRHLRSELIGFFSGARERVGFATEARLQFLTRGVNYAEGENVIELNLRLVRALGISADEPGLEYWPSGGAAVDDLLSKLAGPGPLVVMHPAGATQREKLWDGFTELTRKLRERMDARVVMLGSVSERGLVLESAGSLDPPAVTAVGLPLPEAAEIIRRADLFVGTDSGPAHIADAVGTPGAVLYAPHPGLRDQLRKWKPAGENWLAFTPPRDCGECPEHPCPQDRQKECACSISVSDVASGLQRLYAESKATD